MGGQADDIMPVDKPPKICEVPAKLVPVEVMPPLLAQPTPAAPPADGQPIIPGCFAAVFIPTYLIQRHLKNDSRARALTFATILAVLAAIPTFVTGTPVGLGLLAWTGLGKLFGRTPPK